MIAIIPARGGSKRLPRKNFMPIAGTPMITRAIRVAFESALFTEVIVSTEDKEGIEMAVSEGALVRYRHPVLSDDEVQTASVVFDVLAWRHYQDDSFCVLNPSTPTRDSLLLESLHDNFTDCDCLMTVLAKTREHEGTALFCKTLPFLRTLDFYKLNIKSVPMFLSVDINTEADFRRAECILLS